VDNIFTLRNQLEHFMTQKIKQRGNHLRGSLVVLGDAQDTLSVWCSSSNIDLLKLPPSAAQGLLMSLVQLGSYNSL